MPPSSTSVPGQTAVIAALQLSGSGLLPFGEAQQTDLQLALFDTVNNLVGSDISILNLTEVSSCQVTVVVPCEMQKAR